MAPEEELKQQVSKGLAASYKGMWPEAARLLKEVLDKRPSNPSMEAVARTYLSISLATMGYQDSSRNLLDDALTEARKAVQVFQQTKEPPESVALAHRAVGMSITYLISKEVIRDDEWPKLYPEGISALRKAIELDPQHSGEARKHLRLLSSMENVAKLRGAKTGRCFIATAACADPCAQEVIVLSAFRDDFLLQYRIGRGFVHWYYHLSPAIAKVIAPTSFLRRSAMVLIIRPAVKLVCAFGGDRVESKRG